MVLCLVVFSTFFASCKNEDVEKFSLSVNGENLLLEDLNSEYKAGELIKLKVKAIPYEGVKVYLNSIALAKVKSTQDNFWLFSFNMPPYDSALEIVTYDGFDEPILYGFHLTFANEAGETIEALSQSAESEQAIADYAVISFQDNHKVILSNNGAKVFADSKIKTGNDKFELEDTLYYTYELLDSIVYVNEIYVDESTGKIYSSEVNAGYKIGSLHSLTLTQSLSDIRYNGAGETFEKTFDSLITINCSYIDYLTSVKVLEYNINNELLLSSEISETEAGNTYIVTEDCEYVVIEECYTVKNGEKAGEVYFERTLIDKSETAQGKTLKYPRGDGLISSKYFSVKWEK